jgi:hypothetical protein
MYPTRRTVLISGAALAAMAGLAAVYGPLPAAEPGRRVLSEVDAALVRSIGEAMFPPGGPLGVSANDVDLPAAMDTLLGDALEAEVGLAFRWLIRTLDTGTLASRGARFTELSLEVRQEVLATWSDNAVLPRRMAHDLLRMAFGMAFFNTTAAQDAVGWSPMCARRSA